MNFAFIMERYRFDPRTGHGYYAMNLYFIGFYAFDFGSVMATNSILDSEKCLTS